MCIRTISSILLYIGDAASSVEFLKDKEYLGTVQDMHLNGDYCAVRFDGKILLHVLEGKVTIKIRLAHMFHPNIQISGHSRVAKIYQILPNHICKPKNVSIAQLGLF